jgi:DNA-binding PadR family transcriptional regulator
MGAAARPRRGPGDPAQLGGFLKIERGSLYPALHRLEAQGLIASEWKPLELNRRANYYRLTAAGGNS